METAAASATSWLLVRRADSGASSGHKRPRQRSVPPTQPDRRPHLLFVSWKVDEQFVQSPATIALFADGTCRPSSIFVLPNCRRGDDYVACAAFLVFFFYPTRPRWHRLGNDVTRLSRSSWFVNIMAEKSFLASVELDQLILFTMDVKNTRKIKFTLELDRNHSVHCFVRSTP